MHRFFLMRSCVHPQPAGRTRGVQSRICGVLGNSSARDGVSSTVHGRLWQTQKHLRLGSGRKTAHQRCNRSGWICGRRSNRGRKRSSGLTQLRDQATFKRHANSNPVAAQNHSPGSKLPCEGRLVPSRGCSLLATATQATIPKPAIANTPGNGATNSTSHAAPGVKIPETSRKLE